MKTSINKFISGNIELFIAISALIILLSAVTTVYESIIVLLIAILLSALAIVIRLLFDFFRIEINLFPLVLMLNSTIGYSFGCALSRICKNSLILSVAAVFISVLVLQIFKNLRNSENKLQKKRFFCVAGISAASVILIGLLRELLSTGKILSGITENGVALFPHKLGEHINTFSCFLLIIAFALFIYNLINKNSIYLEIEKGTTVVLSAILAIGSIFSFILFGLSKIIPENIAFVLMVAVISLGAFFLRSEIISSAVAVVAALLYAQNESFWNLVIFAVISSVFIVTSVSVIQIYSKKNSKYIPSAIFLICSIIALIYEKLILVINI